MAVTIAVAIPLRIPATVVTVMLAGRVRLALRRLVDGRDVMRFAAVRRIVRTGGKQ
jgi:hypothetical protein